MNIALIAEYLALAKSLNLDNPELPKPTFADYARANALATQCMIELPIDVWRRVLVAQMSPDWRGVYAWIVEMREEKHPGRPLDPQTEFVVLGPGLGKPEAKRANNP